MKIICDPGRHAIWFGFEEAMHAQEGPEIQIQGETIGLFVDNEMNPRRLKASSSIVTGFICPSVLSTGSRFRISS
jgi:hypothetical protein